MKRKAIITTIILLIVSMFVGVVSAQDTSDNQPKAQDRLLPIEGIFGEMMRLATEETGLTVEEIAQQIRDGATLGEVITNNGGDVETVIASVLETVSGRIQEQVDAGTITQALADQLVATADQLLEDWMNDAAPFPRIGRPNNGRGERIEMGVFAEFVRVVTEMTGLTVQEIAEQMKDGATLSEVITANGGNVDTVTQTVMDSLSSKLQEQVDAGNITSEQMTGIAETAEQRLTDWINGDAPLPRPDRPNNRREQVEQGVFGELARVVTETTGLTVQEIAQQIRDGATLAEVITANGGDVDSVVDSVLESLSTKLQEQVDEGNITGEQMTDIMDAAEQRLNDWMNGDAPFPRPNREGNQRGNGG